MYTHMRADTHIELITVRFVLINFERIEAVGFIGVWMDSEAEAITVEGIL